MMKLATIARILLGLPFLVFGLNGFFHFMETPAPPPGPAAEFMSALEATGYMNPVREGIEVLCGVLLVTGLFVPLGLTLLAPILINILLYHVYLDTTGLPMAIGLVALELFVVVAYREQFGGVLSVFPKKPRADGV